MQLTPQNKARFDEIVARYPVKRSALLPALHLVQEQEGWLSREAIELRREPPRACRRRRSTTRRASTRMFRLKPEGRR